jgi:hypothetical protein
MAHDDGEEIVKIVSEPSGQAADGFHLLGLPKLLLALSQGFFNAGALLPFLQFPNGTLE